MDFNIPTIFSHVKIDLKRMIKNHTTMILTDIINIVLLKGKAWMLYIMILCVKKGVILSFSKCPGSLSLLHQITLNFHFPIFLHLGYYSFSCDFAVSYLGIDQHLIYLQFHSQSCPICSLLWNPFLISNCKFHGTPIAISTTSWLQFGRSKITVKVF